MSSVKSREIAEPTTEQLGKCLSIMLACVSLPDNVMLDLLASGLVAHAARTGEPIRPTAHGWTVSVEKSS